MHLLPTTTLFLAFASISGRPAEPAPVDPRSLFAGHAVGKGTLRLGPGRRRSFHVESQGRALANRTFRLDQVVTFAGEPPRARHWIIRDAGPGRFEFTLSDAAGPGVALAEQGRLRLRYPLGKGLSVQQVLAPSKDGRSIDNHGTIRWLGIPIGRLTETIRRP